MKLKLVHKLLLTHVLVIGVLAIAFLAFSYASNQSLVSDAMNGIDETVLEELVPILAQRYAQEGSFKSLIDDSSQWHQLVNANFFRIFLALSPKPSPVPNANPPATVVGGAEVGKPCEPPFPTFLQRLALLDKQNQPLIAAPKQAAEQYQKPIKVRGEIVGWLRVGKINVDSLPYAGFFFKQQLRLTLWAITCACGIALLLGYLLSKHITEPLFTIARETQKLARRDFSVNIQIDTGDELQVLAQHINIIAGEIKQYNQRQKQWLMDISHELRTPITILFGEVAAILDNVNQVNRGTMQSLQEEVVYLKRLVDDLHALSVLDDGDFHLSCVPLDLIDMVQQQAARYSDRFESNGIKLCLDCVTAPIWVTADRDRLGQVLRNIWENCLRYTQIPGSVSVRVRLQALQACIWIEDSGPGVAAELMPKLFDRLYRLDVARTRIGGGAGLGLAICKTIINAHGGNISAYSSAAGGLGIKIELPLAARG